MDLHEEQDLRDKVIYVHSLWHHHRPTTNPTHNPSTLLQIPKHNPKKFKKQKKRKTKAKKLKKIPPQSDPHHIPDPEWPCPTFPDPPKSAFEWPVLKLNPAPTTRLPTAEEQARFAATQVQQNAVKAAQEFLVDEESDDEYRGRGGCGSDDDEEDDFMDEEDEREEYSFFVKVFDEDGELRGFYKESYESGEFCCLVCGGIGQKVGKRFKGCVALVQHANGIAKTKKRRAHRAFAQVVCEVLGWDIDRLPTRGLSSAESGACQGSAEVGMEGMNMLNQNPVMENGFNAEIISNIDQDEIRVSTVPALSIGVGHGLMFIESHSKVDDADTCMENLDNGYLSSVDGKTGVVLNCSSSLKVGDANMCVENHDCGDLCHGKIEGLVNCLEPFKDSGLGNDMKNKLMRIVWDDNLLSNNKNQKLWESCRDGGNWQVLLRAQWFTCWNDPCLQIIPHLVFTNVIIAHLVFTNVITDCVHTIW